VSETGWIDLSQPITAADLEAIRRCELGASGAGNLQDFQHCYATPVSGCGCSSCVDETQAGQSSVGARHEASAATPPRKEMTMTSFADLDPDAQYEAYLRATGRDPNE
jgi:hypothetical protein